MFYLVVFEAIGQKFAVCLHSVCYDVPVISKNRQKIIQEVRSIAIDVLHEYTSCVYLFGSWARGEIATHSDIDIAIQGKTPLPAKVLFELRDRLEESHVPYRVDVVDLATAPKELRNRVYEEGIPWTV